MKRNVLLAGAFVLALAVTLLLSQQGREYQPAFAQDRENHGGAVLTGTWYWETLMGPGLVVPSVSVFHHEGTVVASGGISFGGTPTNPYRYTPFQGVWERTASHEFRATFYSLRFNGTTGLLVGVARKRVQFWFKGNFDHFAGTMLLDVLPCASPLTCPDPLLAADADWQPFNPPPTPSEFSIRAARISNVPYDD